jgi:hypothetical protein
LAAAALCLAARDHPSVENEHEHNGCPKCVFGQFSDWSEPTNLGPTVNSPFLDDNPAISNDGLTLYITSKRPGGFSESSNHI